MFKEGAQVIPGAISYNRFYHSLKLASTFAGETIDPSQYFSTTTPVTLTGATTGVSISTVSVDTHAMLRIAVLAIAIVASTFLILFFLSFLMSIL